VYLLSLSRSILEKFQQATPVSLGTLSTAFTNLLTLYATETPAVDKESSDTREAINKIGKKIRGSTPFGRLVIKERPMKVTFEN
jgi:hypothetical protein